MKGRLLRFLAGLRVNRPGNAYVLCCFLSTALVATASAALTLFNVTRLGN